MILTLVHTTGSIPLTLAEPNLARISSAVTLDGRQIVGDMYAVPEPITLGIVVIRDTLDEVHDYLISLHRAIRSPVRLEAQVEGQSYTRALRPGGNLRPQEMRSGIVRARLELLPGEAFWRTAGGQPAVLWI